MREEEDGNTASMWESEKSLFTLVSAADMGNIHGINGRTGI